MGHKYNAKRREKVSDALLVRERELLEKKAQAIDELAEILSQIDVFHEQVALYMDQLSDLGMKKNALIELLQPSPVGTKIMKTPYAHNAENPTQGEQEIFAEEESFHEENHQPEQALC